MRADRGQKKKCAFSNKNGYVWTGPKGNCDLYLGALWWATKISRHFPSCLRSRQSKFRDGPLFFWRGRGGGWKIFSCCHCRGDMAVRMRKVLAIPQSCVVWPLLSEGLLIFCVSLFLQALYFSLRTIYFSAYSLCKRFIQNFHPIPLITPSKNPLRVYRSGSRVTSSAATQATFSANHWEVKPEPITSLLQSFLFRAWPWMHSSVLICDWVVSLLFEQKAVAFIWFYDARSKNAQRAFCTQWARSHTHLPPPPPQK